VTDVNASKELLTTTQKARTINFDVPIYGTFAEIGAGQEVAREFFQAGGASGTIAKSISAYDMVFSDAIYGKAPRYVSRERLTLMLDHEYELLLARLAAIRGKQTNFFVFADTVSTRNYQGTNEALGIVGVNLIYGALYYRCNPRELIESLQDNLGSNRVEIDMLRFSGQSFEKVDNRLMSLHLVECKLTNAVMFGQQGEVLQPSEVLHKKAILAV
jgi:hypothetical protein